MLIFIKICLEDGSKDSSWAIKFSLFWCWLLSFALHTKKRTVRTCCWYWDFRLKDNKESLPEMCACTQQAGIFLGLDPLCCTCRWHVLCLPTMFSGLLCHTSQLWACWQTELVFKMGAHTYCLFSDVPLLPPKRVTISGGYRPPSSLCIGMDKGTCCGWLTVHSELPSVTPSGHHFSFPNPSRALWPTWKELCPYPSWQPLVSTGSGKQDWHTDICIPLCPSWSY